MTKRSRFESNTPSESTWGAGRRAGAATLAGILAASLTGCGPARVEATPDTQPAMPPATAPETPGPSASEVTPSAEELAELNKPIEQRIRELPEFSELSEEQQKIVLGIATQDPENPDRQPEGFYNRKQAAFAAEFLLGSSLGEAARDRALKCLRERYDVFDSDIQLYRDAYNRMREQGLEASSDDITTGSFMEDLTIVFTAADSTGKINDAQRNLALNLALASGHVRYGDRLGDNLYAELSVAETYDEIKSPGVEADPRATSGNVPTLDHYVRVIGVPNSGKPRTLIYVSTSLDEYAGIAGAPEVVWRRALTLDGPQALTYDQIRESDNDTLRKLIGAF